MRVRTIVDILFTRVPLNEALLVVISTRLHEDTSLEERTSIPPEVICKHVEFGLNSMFFQVLPQTSAHGHSQLKHQKLMVGNYTEEVLEWSNYPHASALPGCEVSCQGVLNQPASSLCLCFVKATRRWKTVYHAKKQTDSQPSFHSICHLQYVNVVPQGKNATKLCRVGEHQHRLAHQYSLCYKYKFFAHKFKHNGIWGWGIHEMGGAIMTK